MGLTRNQDIDELQQENEELKAQLEFLTSVVFKDAEILLKDDSTWENVKEKRNYLLRSTDWVMTPGATLDQAAWASYRQTLRDIPQTFKKEPSTAVIWPKQPGFTGPNTVK